eukprot:8226691-Karenia_brevis.AAC.1
MAALKLHTSNRGHRPMHLIEQRCDMLPLPNLLARCDGCLEADHIIIIIIMIMTTIMMMVMM